MDDVTELGHAIKIPKVDGLDVLAELRLAEGLHFVPVVVFTSSAEQGDLERAYANGANAYVRKPVDFDEYQDTVKAVCDYWLKLNLTTSHPHAPLF